MSKRYDVALEGGWMLAVDTDKAQCLEPPHCHLLHHGLTFGKILMKNCLFEIRPPNTPSNIITMATSMAVLHRDEIEATYEYNKNYGAE